MRLDSGDAVYVVQFPHPGPEHNPKDATVMPWNAGSHARKFMRSPGRLVDGDGTAHEGSVVFWGEWEPLSRVVDRWAPDGRKPRFLHEPCWAAPADAGLANTDPWVFGERFRFSNCKQLTPRGRPSVLQSLTPGSIVLFGSQVDDLFVLDTVFVIADRTPYTPAKSTQLEVDDAFRACTLERLARDRHERIDVPHARFTLFQGAMHEDPLDGMFCFVPARLADGDDVRFARPPIRLPGYVNPKSKQAPSGARRARTLDDAREVWESVRQQVWDAGCMLGIRIATPPPADMTVVTMSRRRGC